MKSFLDSIDVSTRWKRRKATTLVIDLLEKIRNGEERYLESIPYNLQSGTAYYAADDSVDTIISAIVSLLDAY